VLTMFIFCLVVVTGLLSFGVVVWFVVLGVEEGWGKPTVFNIGGFGQKNYAQPRISRS
jgi:hypothetical protein